MAKIKNKKPLYIGIVIAFVLYVVVMSIWLIVLSVEKKELENEYNSADEELTMVIEENKALEDILAEEDDTSFVVENAHENDYVFPDERVYIVE